MFQIDRRAVGIFPVVLTDLLNENFWLLHEKRPQSILQPFAVSCRIYYSRRFFRSGFVIMGMKTGDFLFRIHYSD